MRRTHIALVQDPDTHWGFDTVGDYQFNATCSGVNKIRYWFTFPTILDPIRVNGKILVPKEEIIMDDNKMHNGYFLIKETSPGEGIVIKGKYKGKKVLFNAGIGIDFQSDTKYTKDILWIE